MMSSKEIVDFVSYSVAIGKTFKEICEEIHNLCLAPKSCNWEIGSDNQTIEIIAILNGKSKDEWYAMVKARYEANPCEPVTRKSKFPWDK